MLPQRQEIASVVVCEDDAMTLELLCDHLVADRFGVLPAPSASDALRLCRYNQPDLLLLDLSLPDASGLDVLREIREADGVDSRFDPHLPVIVLTGRGAADRPRPRPRPRAPTTTSPSPSTIEELRARIGAVLRRRASRREGPIRVGELIVDPLRRKVTVGDREVRAGEEGVHAAAGPRRRPDPGLLQGGAAARRSGATAAPAGPAPWTRTPAGCGANSTRSTAATSSTAGGSATA